MTHPNMKFRIKDEAHSEAIQRKLFELGFGWYMGYNVAQYTDKPVLLAYGVTKSIKYGFDIESFPHTEYVLSASGELIPVVDDNGFTHWEGGACPVFEGTVVDVKYRDGGSGTFKALVSDDSSPRDAGWSFWCNDDADDDIVAYRVHTQTKHQYIHETLYAPIMHQQINELRPQRDMWVNRAAELLEAMNVRIDHKQQIPQEWLIELTQVNERLSAAGNQEKS